MADKTENSYLHVEAHNGLAPILPYFARCRALVIQYMGQASVVCVECFLFLVEVSRTPVIVVNVPAKSELVLIEPPWSQRRGGGVVRTFGSHPKESWHRAGRSKP